MISGLMQIIQISIPWAGAQKQDTHCSLLSVSAACTCVSSSPQGTSSPDTSVTATCPCTETGGQVLAENGQGGEATPWICQ